MNNLVTNTCDTLKEGFLNNPRACRVDFSTLKCQAGKSGNTCLTDAQMKTVETFYGGVKNSKGELIFSGQALGNPIGASAGESEPGRRARSISCALRTTTRTSPGRSSISIAT